MNRSCVAKENDEIEYRKCYFQGIETLLNWIERKANLFDESLEQRVKYNNAKNIMCYCHTFLFLLSYWYLYEQLKNYNIVIDK